MNDSKNMDDSLQRMSKEVIDRGEETSVSTVAEEDIGQAKAYQLEQEEASIEPPNGGFAAWLVVFGGFCVSNPLMLFIDMM